MTRKRQEAPGELERLREFVNTLEVDTRVEELAGPVQLRDWLVSRGLAPAGVRVTQADVARVQAVREALRETLISHTEGTTPPASASRALDEAALRARLCLRFGVDGTTSLEPGVGGVDGALGRLLSIVHRAITEGSWERLKACREHTCEWAFYDHTKNRSGAWCTMEVCGNRAKARAYRERQPGTSTQ